MNLWNLFLTTTLLLSNFADPDQGSCAFLTPGSRIPDPQPIFLRAYPCPVSDPDRQTVDRIRIRQYKPDPIGFRSTTFSINRFESLPCTLWNGNEKNPTKAMFRLRTGLGADLAGLISCISPPCGSGSRQSRSGP